MPENRRHRGPHPQDHELFAPACWPRLRRAVCDLSWLWGRAYAKEAALKLVGDHYQLDRRQRLAVMRSACADEALERRRCHEVHAPRAAGQTLHLDGFNVLTTVEAALAGGVLLKGRDGCLRDMASMHGSYRKVEETVPAAELIGATAEALDLGDAVWYLDQPVSNSGRLKVVLGRTAAARRWAWQVLLVPNPDRTLIDSPGLIATADSVILDRCRQWLNLAGRVVEQQVPDAIVVDLSVPGDR